jgi:hypothetical protein
MCTHTFIRADPPSPDEPPSQLFFAVQQQSGSGEMPSRVVTGWQMTWCCIRGCGLSVVLVADATSPSNTHNSTT